MKQTSLCSTAVGETIDEDEIQGILNLHPISDEILKCENIDGSIKEMFITEEQKISSGVTQIAKDKKDNPNDSDNVPE